MKKILLFLIFLTGIFAQSVAVTEITPTNLKEAVFYSRNVYNNVVFVGDIDATSDRDGQKIQGAVNTIADAVTVANSLAPSSSNQVTIFVVDGRTYTETLTLPNYVNIIGIGATFSGITAGSTSSNIVQLSDVGGTIAAGNVSFIPYGIIASTNVQNAIQELVDEKQDSSSRLTNIVDLTPQELALIQFNSDTLRVRTLDSIKVDLALTSSDVGLGNVTNNAQLKRAAGDINSFTQKGTINNNDWILIEDSEDSNNKKKVMVSQVSGAAGGESNDLASYGGGTSIVANPSKVGTTLYPKDLIAGSGVAFASTDTTITVSASAPTMIIKPSDESVSNSTTLQDDDYLKISYSTGDTVSFKMVMYVVGDQSADFKCRMQPSGSSVTVTSFGPDFQTTNRQDVNMRYDWHGWGDAEYGLGILGGVTTYVTAVVVNGYFVATSTTTTALRWAQRSSNATATKVLAGSYVEYIIK